MKISVIIPVYNAAQFLSKAVESAIIQDEVDEIVLVEDGSTDDSLRECEEIERENRIVRLLRHPGGVNRGAGASRNLGIMKAKNEWIAFLDADDYYLPNRFSADTENIYNCHTVDGCYNAVGSTFYNKNDKILSDFRGREMTTIKEIFPAEDLFFYMGPIGNKGHIHLDGLTIKKIAAEQVGMFDESLRLSQDTHFILKIAASYKLIPSSIKEPVAVRGIHLNNRSTIDKMNEYKIPMALNLLHWMLMQNRDPRKIERTWKLVIKTFKGSSESSSPFVSALYVYKKVLPLFWKYQGKLFKTRLLMCLPGIGYLKKLLR